VVFLNSLSVADDRSVLSSVVFLSLLFVCFCCVFGAFFHLLLLPFWRIKMYIVGIQRYNPGITQ